MDQDGKEQDKAHVEPCCDEHGRVAIAADEHLNSASQIGGAEAELQAEVNADEETKRAKLLLREEAEGLKRHHDQSADDKGAECCCSGVRPVGWSQSAKVTTD